MSDQNYRGPGVYRHFKGGEYEVLGLAVMEATVGSNPSSPLYGVDVEVVYRPLGPSLLEDTPVTFWTRPLYDFDSEATIKATGEKVPRFVLVGPSKTTSDLAIDQTTIIPDPGKVQS